MRFREIKLFIIISLFVLVLPVKMNAASDNVEIFPYVIDEIVLASDILEYNIRIKNNTENKASLYAIVDNVSADRGRQRSLEPTQMDKTISLANWIRIKRSVIELMPGEEIEVPLTIKVNLAAKPGKYYSIITFSQGNNISVAEKNVYEKKQPQLMINIEVEEKIVEKAQIVDFKTGKDLYIKNPIDFILNINNLGNKEIVPSGSIYIYNKRGEEIDEININQTEIEGGVEKIPAGEKLEKIYEWFSGKGFGRFKARLDVSYGQEDQRDLQDIIYFWILPWPVLIIFIGGLFIIALSLTLFLFKRTYSPRYSKKKR